MLPAPDSTPWPLTRSAPGRDLAELWDTIAGLRQRDIRLDDATVVVDSLPLSRAARHRCARACPVAAVHRFATVFARSDPHPGHIYLHHTLT